MAIVMPPKVLVVIKAIKEIMKITNEIAAMYVRLSTFAALNIFSRSSLKINNCASSADRYALRGRRVTDVPSSVSFSEYLEPYASLNEFALSVNLVKFSKSNKSSSTFPNCW